MAVTNSGDKAAFATVKTNGTLSLSLATKADVEMSINGPQCFHVLGRSELILLRRTKPVDDTE